jgi:hypothetical protein
MQGSRGRAEMRDPRVEKAGGDDETRTRDLCRDRVTPLGFTTTYKYAGTAKIPVSRTRHRMLWVGLWVWNLPLLPLTTGSPLTSWLSSPNKNDTFRLEKTTGDRTSVCAYAMSLLYAYHCVPRRNEYLHLTILAACM